MKNILITYSKKYAFVQVDVEIISAFSKVFEYQFWHHKNPFFLIVEFLKQFFFLLFRGHKYDVYYVWFSDFHGFLPAIFAKIYQKKLVVVLGGYDTMAIPELNYGIFLKQNWRSSMCRYLLRNAGVLLGVDASMFKTTNTYLGQKHLDCGVDVFVEGIKAQKIVLPTGYDPQKWKCDTPKQENLILTIGGIDSEKSFKRKGLDLFCQIARNMPEARFVLIGLNPKYLSIVQKYNIPNLELYGFVGQDFLLKMASQAKVFCQLSLAEGLPNTLCEAMLCECIPVGSSVNGIPLAIGNDHLIVQKRDPEEAIRILRLALKMDASQGKIYRERIIKLFPKTKRKEELERILNA